MSNNIDKVYTFINKIYSAISETVTSWLGRKITIKRPSEIGYPYDIKINGESIKRHEELTILKAVPSSPEMPSTNMKARKIDPSM